MPNTGLILEPVMPRSMLLGANLPVRVPDGDWTPFLPMYERQSKLGLETMNCVQFSFLNCLEMIAKSYGKTLSLSDRFLYWASGCGPNGNTYSRCLAGFAGRSVPDEAMWPWTEPMSRDEYGREPPEDVRREALKLMSEWDFGGVTYVPSSAQAMRSALTRSPLWFCNAEHSMALYRFDDAMRVLDTYDHGGDGKLVLPASYVPNVEAAYNVVFTPKDLTVMPIFSENTLYQYVEPSSVGGFLLFAKGRMYRDTEAKILSSWVLRNSKRLGDGSSLFTEGPTGTLRQKDLAGVQLYNLKDEPVNL